MKLLPRIHRCMCGCSLRTGLLIWLWLSLVMAIPLIINEILYLLSGSGNPYLLWHHIFQLSSAVGWTVINIVTLFAIYKKKPSWLLSFLWFSLISILASILILILLLIFWSDFINSEMVSIYLQEMLLAEESRLSPNDKRLLYDKIRELLAHFALPVIEITGICLIAFESYVTIAMYSLYKQMMSIKQMDLFNSIERDESRKAKPEIMANPMLRANQHSSIN